MVLVAMGSRREQEDGLTKNRATEILRAGSTRPCVVGFDLEEPTSQRRDAKRTPSWAISRPWDQLKVCSQPHQITTRVRDNITTSLSCPGGNLHEPAVPARNQHWHSTHSPSSGASSSWTTATPGSSTEASSTTTGVSFSAGKCKTRGQGDLTAAAC